MLLTACCSHTILLYLFVLSGQEYLFIIYYFVNIIATKLTMSAVERTWEWSRCVGATASIWPSNGHIPRHGARFWNWRRYKHKYLYTVMPDPEYIRKQTIKQNVLLDYRNGLHRMKEQYQESTPMIILPSRPHGKKPKQTRYFHVSSVYQYEIVNVLYCI